MTLQKWGGFMTLLRHITNMDASNLDRKKVTFGRFRVCQLRLERSFTQEATGLRSGAAPMMVEG